MNRNYFLVAHVFYSIFFASCVFKNNSKLQNYNYLAEASVDLYQDTFANCAGPILNMGGILVLSPSPRQFVVPSPTTDVELETTHFQKEQEFSKENLFI